MVLTLVRDEENQRREKVREKERGKSVTTEGTIRRGEGITVS